MEFGFEPVCNQLWTSFESDIWNLALIKPQILHVREASSKQMARRHQKRLVSYDRKIAIFHKCLILGWVFGVKLSDEDIADFEVVRVVAMATGFSFPYMGCTFAPPGKYDCAVAMRPYVKLLWPLVNIHYKRKCAPHPSHRQQPTKMKCSHRRDDADVTGNHILGGLSFRHPSYKTATVNSKFLAFNRPLYLSHFLSPYTTRAHTLHPQDNRLLCPQFPLSYMFVNVHQVGLTMILITQPDAKNVPNCDISFANGELHQAYGHVTLTMSAWPKYDHRSLSYCHIVVRVSVMQHLQYRKKSLSKFAIYLRWLLLRSTLRHIIFLFCLPLAPYHTIFP